jgi:hypothetical protein
LSQVVEGPTGRGIVENEANASLGPRGGLSRGAQPFTVATCQQPPPGRQQATPAAEAAPAAASKAPPGPPPLKEPIGDEEYEALRDKTVGYFVEDYDVAAAVKAVAEWEAPERHAEFVEHVFWTEGSRPKLNWVNVSSLLLALAREKVMSHESIAKGFRRVFDAIGDFSCDLPKWEEHASTLLAPLILDGFATLGAVRQARATEGACAAMGGGGSPARPRSDGAAECAGAARGGGGAPARPPIIGNQRRC